MEPQFVYHEDTRVKTYETDFQKRLKPASLLRMLIETASEHAAALGFSYSGLFEKNLVWVLSRVKIRIAELPAVGESVHLKTWPKGIQQKLFFMRDFEITGDGGKTLGAASFAWLLIDPAARRMLTPQALGAAVPDNGGFAAIAETLEKINPPDDMPERFTALANYSAVDLVGHVNAARYLEWICDCFPHEHYETHRLAWLQINYINETRPGETLSIRTAQMAGDPLTWYAAGINLATGARSFEAALGWEKI